MMHETVLIMVGVAAAGGWIARARMRYNEIKDMKLTEHFTVAELTHSNTALAKAIPNLPNDKQINNLRVLAEKVLQPIRDKFGSPVGITSGYRSPLLNAALRGSAAKSYHMRGMAADFLVQGEPNALVYDWIVANLEFTECFLEGSGERQWIHVAYDPNNLKKEFAIDRVVGDGVGVA